MASITLTEGWLTLASDPSQSVVSRSSVDENDAKPSEVRRFANGRLRIITRAGSQKTLKVTLHNISVADLETVRSWRGMTVLWRDRWGRKVYGSYPSITPGEFFDGTRMVEFTLAEATYSEAV